MLANELVELVPLEMRQQAGVQASYLQGQPNGHTT